MNALRFDLETFARSAHTIKKNARCIKWEASTVEIARQVARGSHVAWVGTLASNERNGCVRLYGQRIRRHPFFFAEHANSSLVLERIFTLWM